MAYKGKFTPKNPNKYVGKNLEKIRYLSYWEFLVMKQFDEDERVLEWSSESIILPYFNPIQKKTCRYFVDLYAKIRNASTGVIAHYMFEVKPKKQTMMPPEPKPGARKSRTYAKNRNIFLVNEQKFKTAHKFASENGMTFSILTEDQIFPKKAAKAAAASRKKKNTDK